MQLPFDDWLAPPVRHVPSPNFDERPAGSTIEALIVHAISLPPGVYGGNHIEALFRNRLDADAHPYFRDVASMRVSAHFLIDRAGEVTQFVAIGKRAWHAGESCCLGRQRVNDFSIGVELEGCDHESFTMAQYVSLASLIRGLRMEYPVLDDNRLFGHSDIAPGRKTDPGPFFDWKRLKDLLNR